MRLVQNRRHRQNRPRRQVWGKRLTVRRRAPFRGENFPQFNQIMSKENIIKKITIDIADTEIEVTPKQALALYEALGELLNQPKEKVIEKHVYERPWYPRWQWAPGITLYGAQPLTIGSGAYTVPDADKYRITYTANSNTVALSVT